MKRAVFVSSVLDAASSPVGRLAPGESAGLDREDLPGLFRMTLPDGRSGFVSKAGTVVSRDCAGALHHVPVDDHIC